MYYTKPVVTSDAVLEFLRRTIDEAITCVIPIRHNMGSTAFSFSLGDTALILRLAHELCNFEKDRYASEHFASRLPIPRLTKLGSFDENLYFAISVRAPGDVLANFSQAIIAKILPKFIALLDDIRETPLPFVQTYGRWEGSGEASERTWRSYLLSIATADHLHWPQLIRERRVDPRLLERAFHVISTLTAVCPEEHHLIHGDFGLHNVLSDGQSITGVIDWGDSIYGDFLYDVAWLDFLWSGWGFSEMLLQHFFSIGLKVANYQERLLCYKLHCALGLMNFWAGSFQEALCLETRNRILTLLQNT